MQVVVSTRTPLVQKNLLNLNVGCCIYADTAGAREPVPSAGRDLRGRGEDQPGRPRRDQPASQGHKRSGSSVYLSICLSVYLSICLSVYMSLCLSVTKEIKSLSLFSGTIQTILLFYFKFLAHFSFYMSSHFKYKKYL